MKSLASFALLLLLSPTVCTAFSPRVVPYQRRLTKLQQAFPDDVVSRRRVLSDAASLSSSCVRLAALVASATLAALPGAGAVQAAETTASSSLSTLTVQSILQALRNVPTFCIVNDQGAAYMLYKANEGFAKGYAFLTYDGADVVLKDALTTAEKGGYAETWKTATITTIPADIALRLTLQPRKRQSQREQSANSVLFLIPGAADREAAMEMDRIKFQEQGKVPLFYLETFRNDAGALPLYFNPRDLVQDWQRQSTGDDKAIPPRIQVIDLVTMFGFVVRGRTAELPAIVQSNPLAFVPHGENVQKAKELQAAGLVPYKLDQMMI